MVESEYHSPAAPCRSKRGKVMSAAASRAAGVFASIVAMVVLSQYFRTSLGVIAPELARDVDLTPESLGLINGSFFITLGLAQIPVGMAFDRYGPRLTITALTGLAMLGSLWFAAAQSAETLLAARVVIGLGCAGSFMGAVVLTSRWAAPDRFTQTLSWIFALSNLGTLVATTPLAAASEAIGWRATFVLAAVVTALTGSMFLLCVRDSPPGRMVAAAAPERLTAILRGLFQVWRTPNLGNVLAIHTVAYATLLTVQGLWAGPYLFDVHGMGSVERGNVLFAMAGATVLGILCYGPLDRRLNTRKWVVSAGALITVGLLTSLALLEHPPRWLAGGLLVLLGFVGSYGIVIVAHGRSLFPDRLVGRGVTTVNLAQAVGCAALPIITGAVVGLFPRESAGVTSETAYRAAFGCLGLILLVGLLLYQRASDSRPLDEAARSSSSDPPGGSMSDGRV